MERASCKGQSSRFFSGSGSGLVAGSELSDEFAVRLGMDKYQPPNFQTELSRAPTYIRPRHRGIASGKNFILREMPDNNIDPILHT